MRLALMAALAIPVWAQSAGEITKLIGAISTRFSEAKEYSYEGELTLSVQRGEAPGRLAAKARVKLAVGPEGRYFLHLAPAGKDDYMLVSSGQKNWAYVPALKQYTEEEGARAGNDETGHDEDGAGAERDPSETFARTVVPILATLRQRAEAADMSKTATVKFEGKKAEWPVLRVVSRKNAAGEREMTELTLDPPTLRIGRLTWNHVGYRDAVKTLISLEVDFSAFRANESLPESTFTFEPPQNAKLVDAVPIPGQTGSFLLNKPAPDFDLKTIDGKQRVRLADLRGRMVLLSFWASWCGPCRRELPALVKLHEQFKERGLVVLGVDDEDPWAAREFVKKAGVSFPALDDGGQKAHRLYRVRSIPSIFLIDREGIVVRFFSGSRDEERLRAAVRAAGLPE